MLLVVCRVQRRFGVRTNLLAEAAQPVLADNQSLRLGVPVRAELAAAAAAARKVHTQLLARLVHALISTSTAARWVKEKGWRRWRRRMG